MNKILGTLAAVGCAVSLDLWAAEAKAPENPKKPVATEAAAPADQRFKSEKEKVSYCLGLLLGRNFKMQDIEVDTDAFSKGLADLLAGGKLLLSDKEVEEVMTAFQNKMQAKQQERMAKQLEQIKAMGEKNKRDGEAFLAENKKKPGVVTLPSGLQYKVITEGNGPTPKATDSVTAHYRGTLIDGTEFDSSLGKDPVTFSVGDVILGWQEALKLMKVGSKWRLYIPSELAYKEHGAGPKIGPNAVLIFDVELLAIAQKPAHTEAAPK